MKSFTAEFNLKEKGLTNKAEIKRWVNDETQPFSKDYVDSVISMLWDTPFNNADIATFDCYTSKPYTFYNKNGHKIVGNATYYNNAHYDAHSCQVTFDVRCDYNTFIMLDIDVPGSNKTATFVIKRDHKNKQTKHLTTLDEKKKLINTGIINESSHTFDTYYLNMCDYTLFPVFSHFVTEDHTRQAIYLSANHPVLLACLLYAHTLSEFVSTLFGPHYVTRKDVLKAVASADLGSLHIASLIYGQGHRHSTTMTPDHLVRFLTSRRANDAIVPATSSYDVQFLWNECSEKTFTKFNTVRNDAESHCTNVDYFMSSLQQVVLPFTGLDDEFLINQIHLINKGINKKCKNFKTLSHYIKTIETLNATKNENKKSKKEIRNWLEKKEHRVWFDTTAPIPDVDTADTYTTIECASEHEISIRAHKQFYEELCSDLSMNESFAKVSTKLYNKDLTVFAKDDEKETVHVLYAAKDQNDLKLWGDIMSNCIGSYDIESNGLFIATFAIQCYDLRALGVPHVYDLSMSDASYDHTSSQWRVHLTDADDNTYSVPAKMTTNTHMRLNSRISSSECQTPKGCTSPDIDNYEKLRKELLAHSNKEGD